MELWYFAYGSNLCTNQMIARIGSIGRAEQGPRIARLANHRLVFQSLEAGGAAYANILCPGDGVLGVLYRCSLEDLEKLDRYEGGYNRQPISAIDPHGEVLSAVAYFVRPVRGMRTGKPSAEYLERIVKGARLHGLPNEYIDNIVASASSEMNQNVDCYQLDS